MISGINHITLAVSDLAKSLAFYRDVLGFKQVYVWDGGAYLEAGNVWICLSPDATTQPTKDYSHIAFDVELNKFNSLANKIIQSGMDIWKENSSEGESLYFCDPDGHRLEIHVGDLASRLAAIKNKQGGKCGSSV